MTTNPPADYQDFERRMREVVDLRVAANTILWDQMVMMPPGGAAAKASALETLSTIAHARFTDPEVGKLLGKLEGYEASLPADHIHAALIRMTRLDYERKRKVPTELAAKLGAFESEHVPVWLEAREQSDFRIFQPSLQKAVDLNMQLIDCYDGADAPYDILLDRNEMGLTTDEISQLFSTVRDGLKPLIALVAANKDAVSDEPVRGDYPADRQAKLARELVEGLGFSSDAWRLDETVHPFEVSFSVSDIRLTTKYVENDLSVSMGGAIHEFGHGLYERQSDPELDGLPTVGGASLALHESQSRTWEILVGGRRSFWKWAYPIFARHFPEHAAKWDDEAMYRAVNKMEPSLIRTESDQLTYGMHIILRFELERELIGGTLKVADVPEAWNARMKDYLDVDVPDDKRGVLQDIHWAGGQFGGFPAYLIGTVISSHAWTMIERDIPDIDDRIAAGDFAPLRGWSARHLHRMGSKYTARKTIERFLGGPIDPQPYLTYLESRVNELYS